MRRGRQPTPGELALWRHALRDVAPLPGRDLRLPEQASMPAEELDPPAPQPASLPGKAPDRPAMRPPPLAPLERKLRQRLSRGSVAVDAHIDLHGLRQAEAHRVLLQFVQQAQRSGARVVLVVTGKGGEDSAAVATAHERGVLRRLVPHWLAEPGLRGLVLGFEQAARGHGGGGALYVRIRRARKHEG
jgi:DNA-nicking Smr family endonuclease